MLKLLVCDPHRNNSEWVKQLQQEGFKLKITGNGEEAIEALDKEWFNAVLVNSVLPDMLGQKLAAFIKRIHSDVSVFVLTNETNMEMWREISKCKAHLLPLPLEIDRLHFILDQQPIQGAKREIASSFEEVEDDNDYSMQSDEEAKGEKLNVEEKMPVEDELSEEVASEPIIEKKPRPKLTKKQLREVEQGRVILLYSWKGGVGKTTTAVNLASLLQTYGDLSVGLIELTRQTGNILSHFSLMPTVTVKTWLDEKPNETNAFSRMLEDPATGLYILPSQTLLDHSKDPINLKIHDALYMIKVLRQILDVVVIDAGTLLDDFLFTLFDESDYVILVSDLTFDTLKENHYMPEIIKRKNLDLEKFIHLINKVDKGLGVSVKDAIGIVAIPSSYSLPYRKQIIKKKENKEPFILSHDNDLYTNELKVLAAELFPDIDKLQMKPSWWKKMMNKVVG